jgi:hypothetical protein
MNEVIAVFADSPDVLQKMERLYQALQTPGKPNADGVLVDFLKSVCKRSGLTQATLNDAYLLKITLGEFSVTAPDVIARFTCQWGVGQLMKGIIKLLEVQIALRFPPTFFRESGNSFQISLGLAGQSKWLHVLRSSNSAINAS